MSEPENTETAEAVETPTPETEGEATAPQEEVAQDTEDSTEPTRPDFNALGYEFNAKLADILASYEDQLPYIYMAKIMMNLSVDLLAQQNAVQARYTMEQVVAKAQADAQLEQAPPSRLVRV